MTSTGNVSKSEREFRHGAWSTKVKIARCLWFFFQPLFMNFWGRSGSSLRVAALRLFGSKIGDGCVICGGVKVWMPWNLTLGNRVAIGAGVELYNFGKINIGSRVIVSQRTYLCTASHDYSLENLPLYWETITVGDWAWVCAESFVGPGVTIGEGCVVGARSVVTKKYARMESLCRDPLSRLESKN